MVYNKIYGVITGDLVKSSLLKTKRREVLSRLKKILKLAENLESNKNEFIIFSDIFRGDSFQAVISNPAYSLKVALFIRAELLKSQISKQKTEVRMGVGIGTIDSLNKSKIEESDGEAFRYSGKALDMIKKFRRFSILSLWREANKDLDLLASLLDAIIQRWTVIQAEAVSLWLQGETQESISEMLEKKQPAVQQRLQVAGHFALKEALEYFNSIISKYKNGAL